MPENITIGLQIDPDSLLYEFMEKIFGIDIDEALVTEDSQISDFSFSGTDELVDYTLPLKELYEAWDKAIIQKIEDVYAVKVNVDWTIIATLNVIRINQKQPILH